MEISVILSRSNRHQSKYDMNLMRFLSAALYWYKSKEKQLKHMLWKIIKGKAENITCSLMIQRDYSLTHCNSLLIPYQSEEQQSDIDPLTVVNYLFLTGSMKKTWKTSYACTNCGWNAHKYSEYWPKTWKSWAWPHLVASELTAQFTGPSWPVRIHRQDNTSNYTSCVNPLG